MKKRYFFIFALSIVNAILLFKILDSESGYPAYKNVQNTILKFNEKISEIDNQNIQISSEIRVLKKNTDYVERLIKRDFFYVSENETMYIFK